MPKRSLILGLVLLLPVPALAAGVPLLDAAGASHGSVKLNLGAGKVQMKIVGLAPLPADVPGAAPPFTATLYKAYLASSLDPAIEIFLGDVYPNGKLKASRKVALGGDVGRLGFDRVTVTAFSKDGQQAFDVLTATIAP